MKHCRCICKKSCKCSCSQREEVSRVWVSSEVTILLFQLWASFSSELRSVSQPSVLLLLSASPYSCSTYSWLLLCYSSVWPWLVSLSAYSSLCCLTAGTERQGELWRTWNRNCFDDVPEVLRSGHSVLFLQITAQINTLALADPKQAMPPESNPQGLLALPLPVIIVSALLGELPQTNGCCKAHWAKGALF